MKMRKGLALVDIIREVTMYALFHALYFSKPSYSSNPLKPSPNTQKKFLAGLCSKYRCHLMYA